MPVEAKAALMPTEAARAAATIPVKVVRAAVPKAMSAVRGLAMLAVMAAMAAGNCEAAVTTDWPMPSLKAIVAVPTPTKTGRSERRLATSWINAEEAWPADWPRPVKSVLERLSKTSRPEISDMKPTKNWSIFSPMASIASLTESNRVALASSTLPNSPT